MWDKNKPAGNQKIRLSDEEIRANWAALEDALSREHIFPGTEGVDAGEHKAVTLRQQGTAPDISSGKVGVYAKDDGQLYYVDPNGNEYKLWHAGNDGENSGLDADTVRGFEVAKKDLSNIDDDTFLDKIKEVDGEGSGVDADLIRGLPGDFTCLKEGNGYMKFPNGLIIQWGAVGNVNGDAEVVVNFPIEFPNVCFTVVAVADVAFNVDQWAIVRDVNNTSFVARMEYYAGNKAEGIIRWIAIGY